MNMNFEPMLAIIGLGGWEIVLVLGVVLCLTVIPACVVAAIVYLVLRSSKSKPQPAPLARPTGLIARATAGCRQTEVLPRKCPQCGAALPADTPEGLCPACLLQRGFATEGGAPTRPAILCAAAD